MSFVAEEVKVDRIKGKHVLWEKIATLRYAVWKSEGKINTNLFPDGKWWDELDDKARHWVIQVGAEPVAAARLTLHASSADEYRDVAIFEKNGVSLDYPICDLGRLVVDKSFRDRGFATALIDARLCAAKQCGAGAVISTSSPALVPLLKTRGFQALTVPIEDGKKHVDYTCEFADRPGAPFQALYLVLSYT